MEVEVKESPKWEAYEDPRGPEYGHYERQGRTVHRYNDIGECEYSLTVDGDGLSAFAREHFGKRRDVVTSLEIKVVMVAGPGCDVQRLAESVSSVLMSHTGVAIIENVKVIRRLA